MSQPPTSTAWFSKLIQTCFWFLAAVIALTISVDLLRQIWLWVAGGAGTVIASFVGWKLWQLWQQSRW